MGVFPLLYNRDIIELDVEKLVDGFKCPANGEVVLELDCYFVVDEGLEEARGSGRLMSLSELGNILGGVGVMRTTRGVE